MKMNVRTSQAIIVLLVLSFAACKKSKVNTQNTTPVVPTASRQQLTLDSIYLYAKQIYYWNDKITASYETFNPRQYTNGSTDLDNYEDALLAIAKFSQPYEWKAGATSPKFSYIFEKSKKNPSASINPKSSVDLEGNGNDLGVRFGLYGTTSNYVIYATSIYQNSPADAQGMHRGDVIKKINGQSYGTNYNAEVGPLNTALSGNSVELEGIKGDGVTPFTITLNKATFKSNPIYKTNVYTAGAKKIGYLAYARFSNANNSAAVLDAAFADFANKGVTDLIIDLRYNGGGYVSTAERLINLIAPSTANGVMFSEYYNATMQAGLANILAKQPLLDGNGKIQYGSNGEMITYAKLDYSINGNTKYFAKLGALNSVKNIVFIVSGSTASASELVINSLKPHVNVKLVGKTTYGKPIGFFPITLENKYDVYFSLFETKNSAGQGGYYDGMTPDYVLDEVPTGTVMYDFGDIRDNYLKKALEILAPGETVSPTSYKYVKGTVSLLGMPATSQMIHADFLDNEFKGMVENRFKLK